MLVRCYPFAMYFTSSRLHQSMQGDISFDQNGNRQTGTVQIEQYRTMYTNSTNNDLVNEVIAISRGGTFQFINGQNLDSVWPGEGGI